MESSAARLSNLLLVCHLLFQRKFVNENMLSCSGIYLHIVNEFSYSIERAGEIAINKPL